MQLYSLHNLSKYSSVPQLNHSNYMQGDYKCSLNFQKFILREVSYAK
jgi:hypothetical protein